MVLILKILLIWFVVYILYNEVRNDKERIMIKYKKLDARIKELSEQITKLETEVNCLRETQLKAKK